MTMIDDDRLRALFAQAAEVFDVPESGVAALVTARAEAAGATGTVDNGSEANDTELADASAEMDGTPVGPSRGRVGRLRRVGPTAGGHHVLSIAACIVVLLLLVGLVGALVHATSSPTSTSGRRALAVAPAHQAPSAHKPAAPLTTTTAPGDHRLQHGASGTAQSAAGLGSATNGSSALKSASSNQAVAKPTTTSPTSTVPTLPAGTVGQPAKVEQTGTLGLTVKKGALSESMTQLSTIATGAGGFVAGTQTQASTGTAGTPSGSITLQVPEADFASVLAQAQALGTTSNLSTKATDVTGQFDDLQDQLTALQASQQQYLAIMAKATSVGDILSVQEQLDTIDQQINQLQGQLQLLTSQTTYSTLSVTVSEPGPPPPAAPAHRSGVAKAWHDSVTGFADGVEGVIRYAGPFLFALLCLALVWLGGRVLWRRFQRHNL